VKTKLLGLVEVAVCMLLIAVGTAWADESASGYAVYDEAAYTESVENSMKELDALYLKFCASCGADPAVARGPVGSDSSRGKGVQSFDDVFGSDQVHDARFLDPVAPAQLGGLPVAELARGVLVTVHAEVQAEVRTGSA